MISLSSLYNNWFNLAIVLRKIILFLTSMKWFKSRVMVGRQADGNSVKMCETGKSFLDDLHLEEKYFQLLL